MIENTSYYEIRRPGDNDFDYFVENEGIECDGCGYRSGYDHLDKNASLIHAMCVDGWVVHVTETLVKE